jgi:hypothetical protein
MYPAIGYDLAEAHVADLRHRAQRDTLARAARRARRDQPGRSQSSLGTWGRRAQARLIALIVRAGGRLRLGRRRRPNSDSCLPDSQLTIRGRSCPQP